MTQLQYLQRYEISFRRSTCKNYNEVLNEKGGWSEEVAAKMFINSFIMALGIATLKVIISAM